MAGGITDRCALTLEYDGTDYAGFQYQENADTVQAQLERALADIFGCLVKIKAASRTDSGVHARGQVVAFNLPRPFEALKLAPAVNWHLPRDIRVVKVNPVPENFDPRTWARGKIYNYYVCNRLQPPAVGSRYLWHVSQPLDIEAINRAASALKGTHDFASFQSAASSVPDTVRTIRHLWARRRGETVILTCVGDGFLHNMVRILAGTLVEIGLGQRPVADINGVLKSKDRTAAGVTAPARGLFLQRVLYRPSLDSYPVL